MTARSPQQKQVHLLGLPDLKWAGVLVLLVLQCLSAPALADEVRVHGVRTDSDEDSENTSATSESIPISEQTPTIGHALQAASGVMIRRSGSLGRTEYLQMRGAMGHQVQVLLEDLPLYGHRGQALNLTTLPLESFNNILVVRGGALKTRSKL